MARPFAITGGQFSLFQVVFLLLAWTSSTGPTLVAAYIKPASFSTGSDPALSQPPEFMSPTFRHASEGYKQLPGGKSSWQVYAAVRWSQELGLAVQSQGECANSWFVGAEASLSSTMTQLVVTTSSSSYTSSSTSPGSSSLAAGSSGSSPFQADAQQMQQQMSALMPAVGEGNNCTGGWPFAAFDFFSQWSTDYMPEFAVLSYEQPSLSFGWMGLLLAVQAQPALIFLHASLPSFYKYTSGIYSDPTCATDNIDHSVMVTGYDLSGPQPYWILLNSWGESWGMKGYMYMAMTGGFGICNMHLVQPLYPVLKVMDDPCNPINPCGSGKCTVTGTGSYTCSCASGFTTVLDGLKGQTCTPVNACTGLAFNPCGSGYCIANNADGSYSCSCPPGLKTGARPDGSPVCRKALTLNNQCSLYYTWNQGDTCTSVASLFSTSLTSLLLLNPALKCTSPIPVGKQVCVLPGTVQETPACSQYYTAVGGDTCSSIRSTFDLSPAQFYTLNPGILCNNLVPDLTVYGGAAGPGIGHQVCIRGSQGDRESGDTRRVLYSAKQCKYGHKVVPGDFCSYIIAKFCNNNVAKFIALNNGFVCTDNKLFVGQLLCTVIPG